MKLTLLLLLLPVALVAAGSLAAQIASFAGPAWVGYRVAVAVPGRCHAKALIDVARKSPIRC